VKLAAVMAYFKIPQRYMSDMIEVNLSEHPAPKLKTIPEKLLNKSTEISGMIKETDHIADMVEKQTHIFW
jgi:hypothetical protein